MKLLLTIIRAKDTEAVMDHLVENGFRVTHIASTGGFLRKGNSTLLIGTDEARVEEALEVIRTATSPAEEGERRATVFVLNVDQFSAL